MMFVILSLIIFTSYYMYNFLLMFVLMEFTEILILLMMVMALSSFNIASNFVMMFLVVLILMAVIMFLILVYSYSKSGKNFYFNTH